MIFSFLGYCFLFCVIVVLFRRVIVTKWQESLQGKVILITGCDSGFGRQLAIVLSHQRAIVLAACLTASGVEALSDTSTFLIPFQMDVTSEVSVDAAFNGPIKMHTSAMARPLYAVVNNAGVLRGGILDLTCTKDLDFQLQVNVVGMNRVTKAALPLLRAGARPLPPAIAVLGQLFGLPGGPRIINVTSSAGRVAAPGVSAYSASKAAATALSDAWRRELGVLGIRVVAVEPGIAKTPLWDAPFAAAAKDWEALPKEQSAFYGDAWFAANQQRASALVQRLGASPSVVVDSLTSALSAVYPPPRVLVGMDAICGFAAIAALPVEIGDVLMAAMFWSPAPNGLL